MILFVTEQWAGAEFYRPLLDRWRERSPVPWRLAAAGVSRDYWRRVGVPFEDLDALSAEEVMAGELLRGVHLVMATSTVGGRREHLIVECAKQLGIPCTQAIDTWVAYGARFVHAGRRVLPDHILAIDARCVDEARRDGLEEARFSVVGQPYYEQLIARRPALGRSILLVGQPVAKYWGRSLGYDETDFWHLAAASLARKPDVLATRHPEEADDGGRIYAGRAGRGAEDVAESHTVLGMYSTQMIVGFLWGRKVASIQPGLAGMDPCPLSRWGQVPRLEHASEVANFLAQPHDPESGEDLRRSVTGSLDRLETFCLEFAGRNDRSQ